MLMIVVENCKTPASLAPDSDGHEFLSLAHFHSLFAASAL